MCSFDRNCGVGGRLAIWVTYTYIYVMETVELRGGWLHVHVFMLNKKDLMQKNYTWFNMNKSMVKSLSAIFDAEFSYMLFLRKTELYLLFNDWSTSSTTCIYIFRWHFILMVRVHLFWVFTLNEYLNLLIPALASWGEHKTDLCWQDYRNQRTKELYPGNREGKVVLEQKVV